jgi:predicted transcriptional regulator
MRVPSDLRLALDQLAKADRRTLASYVEGVLVSHVALTRWKPDQQTGSVDLSKRPARPHPKP